MKGKYITKYDIMLRCSNYICCFSYCSHCQALDKDAENQMLLECNMMPHAPCFRLYNEIWPGLNMLGLSTYNVFYHCYKDEHSIELNAKVPYRVKKYLWSLFSY